MSNGLSCAAPSSTAVKGTSSTSCVSRQKPIQVKIQKSDIGWELEELEAAALAVREEEQRREVEDGVEEDSNNVSTASADDDDDDYEEDDDEDDDEEDDDEDVEDDDDDGAEDDEDDDEEDDDEDDDDDCYKGNEAKDESGNQGTEGEDDNGWVEWMRILYSRRRKDDRRSCPNFRRQCYRGASWLVAEFLGKIHRLRVWNTVASDGVDGTPGRTCQGLVASSNSNTDAEVSRSIAWFSGFGERNETRAQVPLRPFTRALLERFSRRLCPCLVLHGPEPPRANQGNVAIFLSTNWVAALKG